MFVQIVRKKPSNGCSFRTSKSGIPVMSKQNVNRTSESDKTNEHTSPRRPFVRSRNVWYRCSGVVSFSFSFSFCQPFRLSGCPSKRTKCPVSSLNPIWIFHYGKLSWKNNTHYSKMKQLISCQGTLQNEIFGFIYVLSSHWKNKKQCIFMPRNMLHYFNTFGWSKSMP